MTKQKTFEEYLHEEMFGYSMGGKEPIQNFIVRDVGSDFRKAIKPLAPWFIKTVKEKAAAKGLPEEYINYVWWLIYEKFALWPALEKRESTAVFIGRELVSTEYLMPKYGQNFEVPPDEYESAVDATIKAVAKAALKKFTTEGAKAFLAVTAKNAPRLKKAYPEEFPTNSSAQITLMNFFQTALDRYPSWFTNTTIQNRIINGLMAR